MAGTAAPYPRIRRVAGFNSGWADQIRRSAELTQPIQFTVKQDWSGQQVVLRQEEYRWVQFQRHSCERIPDRKAPAGGASSDVFPALFFSAQFIPDYLIRVMR